MSAEIKGSNLIRFTDDSEYYTVPAEVNRIEDLAFAHCDGLISLHIGDNVREIGNYAFSNCYSLREITLPHSVETLGAGLFQKCWNLRTVSFPEGLTAIGTEMLEGCHALTDLYLPSTLKHTAQTAFSSCRNLKNVYTDPEHFDVLPSSARYLAVLTYMEHSGALTETLRSYISSRERSFVGLAVNRRSSKAIRYMIDNNLISVNNAREYIERSVSRGRVEITALLLGIAENISESDPLKSLDF